MSKIDLLKLITTDAKNYCDDAAESLERNTHMNDLSFEELKQFLALGPVISQKIIDALLVDFINSVAANQGVDYGLYTSDLRD